MKENLRKNITQHVIEAFPEHYAALGDKRIIQAVEEGIEDARALGLETDLELCEFVNLVFAFGPGFHERTGFEWVRDIATSSEGPTPRAEQLREKALLVIEQRLRNE